MVMLGPSLSRVVNSYFQACIEYNKHQLFNVLSSSSFMAEHNSCYVLRIFTTNGYYVLYHDWCISDRALAAAKEHPIEITEMIKEAIIGLYEKTIEHWIDILETTNIYLGKIDYEYDPMNSECIPWAT